MERLTIRNSDDTYSQPTHTTFEKMFYKLAEFEDFMEDNGFKSFDDLYYAFGYIRFVDGYDEVKDEEIHKQEFIRYADAYKDRVKAYKELYNKNQVLKYRWQKLKEWSLYMCYFELADKMQELEDGRDTNVGGKGES